MTFNSAAWAIDGALMASSLARRAEYAATGGSEGIVSKGDLKVRQLSTPGIGIQIDAGVGLVLNDYQTSPNETYVVSNPAAHTITAGSMPPSNPAAKSYMVAVVVGDPEFSQVGHPFMSSSDPAPGTETTFTYVRPVLIEVPPNTTKLDVDYPALPLARIDVPPNTTTIIDSYIKDVRQLAQPRSKTAINHATAGGNNTLNGGSGGTPGVYEGFPASDVVTAYVPEWATVAKVTGFLEGARLTKAGQGKLRATIVGGGSTAATNVDESAPRNATDRVSYNIGGSIDIPANLRGTTVAFRVEGTPNNTASKGFLTTVSGATSALLQVIFEEEPS